MTKHFRSLPALTLTLAIGIGLGGVLGYFLGRSGSSRGGAQTERVPTTPSAGTPGKTSGFRSPPPSRPREKLTLLPAPEREEAIAAYLERFEDAKFTLGGTLLTEAYRELVLEAALELGCSNDLVKLRDSLAARGIPGWALSELMHEAVQEAFKTGSPEDHLANWRAIENEGVKLHSAPYLGAILSSSQLEDLIATGLDGGMREFLVSGYAKTFAATDPAGALRTFMEYCSPDAHLIGEIMKEIQPTADFPQLLRLLPEDGPGQPHQARERLLRTWAWADPRAAADHIRGNAGTIDAKHLGRVLETWAYHSARYAEAAAWAEALPQGGLRDQAAASLANRVVKTDPTRAWTLALSMTDQEEGWRRKTLDRIYKHWHSEDPAAADAALDALDVE